MKIIFCNFTLLWGPLIELIGHAIANFEEPNLTKEEPLGTLIIFLWQNEWQPWFWVLLEDVAEVFVVILSMVVLVPALLQPKKKT